MRLSKAKVHSKDVLLLGWLGVDALAGLVEGKRAPAEMPKVISDQLLALEKTSATQSDTAVIECLKNYAQQHGIKLTNNAQETYEFILVAKWDQEYIDSFHAAGFKVTARQARAARFMSGETLDQVSEKTGVSIARIVEIESDQSARQNDPKMPDDQVLLLKHYSESGLHFFPAKHQKQQGEALGMLPRETAFDWSQVAQKAITESETAAEPVRRNIKENVSWRDVGTSEESRAESGAKSEVPAPDITSHARPPSPRSVISLKQAPGKPAGETQLKQEKEPQVVAEKAPTPGDLPVVPKSWKRPEWGGHAFEPMGVHLRMIRLITKKSATDFAADLNVPAKHYSAIEEQRRLTPQLLQMRQYAFSSVISAERGPRWHVIPAACTESGQEHGEGVYQLVDEANELTRLMKSITWAARVLRTSISALCQRAGMNHDLIDIWHMQTDAPDESMLTLVRDFLSPQEVSSLVAYLYQRGLTLLTKLEDKPIIGVMYNSAQQSLPEDMDALLLTPASWSKEQLLEMLEPPSAIASDNDVMSAEQAVAAMALLKLTRDRVYLKGQVIPDADEVDSVVIPELPAEFWGLKADETKKWAKTNKAEWKELQRTLKDNGVIFLKETEHQGEGVMLNRPSPQWFKAHQTQCLLTASQLSAARCMLWMNENTLCYQADVARSTLAALESVDTGISMRASGLSPVISALYSEDIRFIRGDNEHGEGVMFRHSKAGGKTKNVSVVIKEDLLPSHQDRQMAMAQYSTADQVSSTDSGSEGQKPEPSMPLTDLQAEIEAKLSQGAKAQTSSTRYAPETFIHGSVFLIARLISGVDKSDLTHLFNHKYHFLNQLETISEVNISRANLREMLEYFASQPGHVQVTAGTDHTLGSVAVDVKSIEYETLMNRLIGMVPQSLQLKLDRFKGEMKYKSVCMVLQQQGFSGATTPDGRLFISRLPEAPQDANDTLYEHIRSLYA